MKRAVRGLDHVVVMVDGIDAAEAAYARLGLQVQPRGIFDGRMLPALDTELDEGWSEVVKAFVKKDGTPGNKRASDVADADEFAGLLRIVKRRLGELADQIIGGEVGVRPYRLRTESPCPHCEYRPVCRFDVAHNAYHPLEPMTREQVLARAAAEEADA